MKDKKRKTKYVDDGHTVYSMDALSDRYGNAKKKDAPQLNRSEKSAAIRAAFETYLPVFIGIVLCFSAAFVLVYFWLR